MRLLRAPTTPQVSTEWLPVLSGWKACRDPVTPMQVVQHACRWGSAYPSSVRTNVQLGGEKVSHDSRPLADRGGILASRQLMNNKDVRGLVCPYPRKKPNVVTKRLLKPPLADLVDFNPFSFVLSATEEPKDKATDREETPDVDGYATSHWHDPYTPLANDRCALRANYKTRVARASHAPKSASEAKEPSERMQVSHTCNRRDAVADPTQYRGSNCFQRQRRLTPGWWRPGEGRMCTLEAGETNEDHATITVLPQQGGDRGRTRRGRRRSHPLPVAPTEEVAVRFNAMQECRGGPTAIRHMLDTWPANYAEWAAVLEKGAPGAITAFYDLVTRCTAAAQRFRGLLLLANKTVLERLNQFHINDVAALLCCMKQARQLRTDFLLAASPFVASNASHASTRSCCALLESYAALRFCVASSVGALCQALASPDQISCITPSEVATVVGSLARLNLRPVYLLRILSARLIDYSQPSPEMRLVDEGSGEAKLSSLGLSSARAVDRSGLLGDADVSAVTLLPSSGLQPSCGEAHPGTAAVPPVAPPALYPAAPTSITLLLYGLSKLQWWEPRLTLLILRAGIPLCASKMHSHQLAIAAVALARLMHPPRTAPVLKRESTDFFEEGKPTADKDKPVKDPFACLRDTSQTDSSPGSAELNMRELFQREATIAFERITQEACRRLLQFRAEVLCTFLGACVAARLRCNILISRLATSLPRLILTFRPEDVVLLMVAISKLNANSAAVNDVVVAHARRHLGEYNFAAARVTGILLVRRNTLAALPHRAAQPAVEDVTAPVKN